MTLGLSFPCKAVVGTKESRTPRSDPLRRRSIPGFDGKCGIPNKSRVACCLLPLCLYLAACGKERPASSQGTQPSQSATGAARTQTAPTSFPARPPATLGILPETKKTIAKAKGLLRTHRSLVELEDVVHAGYTGVEDELHQGGTVMVTTMAISTAASLPMQLRELESAIKVERGRRTVPVEVARLDEAAAAIVKTGAKHAKTLRSIVHLDPHKGVSDAQSYALQAYATCIEKAVAALEALDKHPAPQPPSPTSAR